MYVILLVSFVCGCLGAPQGEDFGIHNVNVAPRDQCQRHQGYECVPYYLCKDGEIITDGEGVIDLRLGPGQANKQVGGNCPNILDVCCRNGHPYNPPTQQPYTAQCGQSYDGNSNPDFDLRIKLNKTVHGFDNVAQFGSAPWMAAVLKSEGQLNIYQCGGSLIHPQVVMTVAHCVDKLNPGQIRVRLGEWDTTTASDHPYLQHEDHRVTAVVIHEQYGGRPNVYNDVALLFLENQATLNHHINTICLPQPGQQFNGQYCTATGWGKDNFGDYGNYQSILKEIHLPIIDYKSCVLSLQTSRLGCNFCLHDTFICAGGIPEADTCEGDGGSPLVCDNGSGGFVQAGIVAWGIGCGSTLPAAYVDVARYTHWVDDKINKYFNLGQSYYNYNWQRSYQPEGQSKYNNCQQSRRQPGFYTNQHKCANQGFNQGGFNQGGFNNQGGFGNQGFNNQGGFGNQGFNQGGFNQGGFNQNQRPRPGGFNQRPGGFNQG